MYLAAEIYPFYQMYQSVDREPDFTEIFTFLKNVGYNGFEGFLDNIEETDNYQDILSESDLIMKTGYMNLLLHNRESASSEIDRAVAAAERYVSRGLEYLVINPAPLDWNNRTIDKNDGQLTLQLDNLNRLGQLVKEKGVTLSYHTHDSEMAGGGKEIFHMLKASNPDYVTWCFDGDWISRGSGHSPLIMLDWADMFAERISIVHLRQSRETVWCSSVGEGDLDYEKLSQILNKKGINPLFVNEQIPSAPAEAFYSMPINYRKSSEKIKKWFQ